MTQAPLLDIPFPRQPLPGVLTGGHLDPERFDEAQRAGYRLLINLRGHGEPGVAESPAAAAALGMRYVHVPVDGMGSLTPAKAQALADALADAGERPALVYCGSGNRVGALLALKAAWIDGVTPEAAFKLGIGAGMTGLTPVVSQILGVR